MKNFTFNGLRKHPPKFLIYIILSALFLVTCWVNYPGHLSVDSLIQLFEGRFRIYESWNPPFMSFILGLTDKVAFGPGLFLVFNTLIFYAALYCLVSALPEMHWAIVLMVLGVCANPLILIYNGIIWKDVFFSNASLLGFCLLMKCTQVQDRKLLIGLYGLTILCLTMAILIRQQGILVAFVGVIILSIHSERRVLLSTRFLLKIVSIFLLCLCLSSTTSGLIKATAVSYTAAEFSTGAKVIMAFDIAGIVHRRPEANLSVIQERGLNSDAIKADINQLYSPKRIDFLGGPRSKNTAHFMHIYRLSFYDFFQQWLELVRVYPSAYVAHRLDFLSWLYSFQDPEQCLPVWVGFATGDLADSLLAKLALSTPESPYRQQLLDYSLLTRKTPFSKAYFYLFLLLMALLYLGKTFRSEHIPMLGLTIGAILFALTYTVFGIACDLRYVYFSIAASQFVTLYVASDFLAFRRDIQK